VSKPTLDLAIVTCCHNYGRYLDAWARSLVAMTTYPAMVAIVDAGSTDDTPKHVQAALAVLRAAGITADAQRLETANIGRARNAAVRMATTEWVQHFDCDDRALPHMLADFAELMPQADVIPAGYVRAGRVHEGPAGRKRVYRTTQGQSTLKSGAPASGVSPFRRRLWEQWQYPEDMVGGWDTALWIGFAQLDPPARFVATKRPVFHYWQHGDSIFNRRRVDDRRTQLVARKLNALRAGRHGVSVLVPWLSDNGPRDRAWGWLKHRYETVYPDWELVIGRCAGEWRKGRAINDALEQSRGMTLVIADADCVVDAYVLRHAVAMVEAGAPWVIPHGMVNRLDEADTQTIIAGPEDADEFTGATIRKPYRGFAGGGILAVSRSNFEAAGGLPECFMGWGAEDEALAVILDTLVGPHERLDHDLWHLWHPPGSRAAHPHYSANRQAFRMIRSHAGDPDGLWVTLAALQKDASGQPQVPMVSMCAVQNFMLGTRHIVRGATFRVTPEQARRFAVRKNPLAVERGKRVGQVQKELQAAARQIKNATERKLAMAGTRRRAEQVVASGPKPALMPFQQGERRQP
jgi:glycosyltransferase involved in cell wall biosynthesis